MCGRRAQREVANHKLKRPIGLMDGFMNTTRIRYPLGIARVACCTRWSSRTQRGMTLVSVLVSLVIFVLGTLSLAGVYLKMTSAQAGNQQITSLQTYGDRLWALLLAQPRLIGGLHTNGSVTVSAANLAQLSSDFAGLKPLLTDMLLSPKVSLPGATVRISAENNAVGNACEVNSLVANCGVSMVVTWTPPGAATRTQRFAYQVGGY